MEQSAGAGNISTDYRTGQTNFTLGLEAVSQVDATSNFQFVAAEGYCARIEKLCPFTV